jgi:hypothetical protein
MLLEVHEHVDERVAHRARGGEGARVIAIFPHAPPPAERAVHGTGNADGEATHTTRERTGMVCLGDEVEVVVLDGELNDAKARARRRRERTADRREDAGGAKAAKRRDRS